MRPADTSDGIRSRMAIVATERTQVLIFIVMVLCGKIDAGKHFHTLFEIIFHLCHVSSNYTKLCLALAEAY